MPQDPSIQDLIRQEAARQGLPPEYALAVAERESSFDPTKPGTSGELGVMQLMPETAKRYGVNAADPLQNIRGGVQHLRYLMDTYHGDRQKVFAAYNAGEGRAATPPASTQGYVRDVLANIQKYQTPTQGGKPQPAPSAAPPEPRGRAAVGIASKDWGRSILEGFDPRTQQGRRNLAGGAGAVAATALAPEVALPAMLARAVSIGVPLAGAYFGGATEQAGEDIAAGGPPKLSTMQEAGRQQMKYEAVGQTVGAIGKGVGRRVMASGVSQKISKGLADALEAVNTRLESVDARLKMQRPAVSPGKAGQLVEGVVQGPSKAYKDELGEAVGKAAESGPMVPTAPLKDRLTELAEQVTPMPGAGQLPPIMIGGKPAPPQLAAQLAPKLGLSVLPPEHPLPAALDQIRSALTDHDEIPFAEAHKIKTLLDSVVNWDRGAKKPAEQITKGFRQSLREVMRGHAPYETATEQYGRVARLYQDFGADKLAAHIRSNPGEVVQRIKWQNPDGVRLLRDITGLWNAGTQGEAAFSAVRSAWTNEHLIAKGAGRMSAEIERMEASNAGQEFIKTMYGDQAGQTQWQNLKQIAGALRDAQDKITAAQGQIKAFGQTNLAKTAEQPSVVRDLAYAALPGHPITKLGAISRIVLGKGTSGSQMLQWASQTPGRTQFLIKHVLTGPNPGMALADFTRWWMGSDENPDRPLPSHDQGPPTPTAVRR